MTCRNKTAEGNESLVWPSVPLHFVVCRGRESKVYQVTRTKSGVCHAIVHCINISCEGIIVKESTMAFKSTGIITEFFTWACQGRAESYVHLYVLMLSLLCYRLEAVYIQARAPNLIGFTLTFTSASSGLTPLA